MKFASRGPWTVPVDGFRVASVTFSPDVELLLEGERGLVRVGLSGAASLCTASGDKHRLDVTTNPSLDLHVVLGLIGDVVTEAVASKDGGLRISFQSGRRLTVLSDSRAETWEIASGEYKLVGAPDGVAIWDDRRE